MHEVFRNFMFKILCFMFKLVQLFSSFGKLFQTDGAKKEIQF